MCIHAGAGGDRRRKQLLRDQRDAAVNVDRVGTPEQPPVANHGHDEKQIGDQPRRCRDKGRGRPE